MAYDPVYHKAYREKNRERLKQQMKDWYLKNQEEHIEKRRLYYEENKDQVLARHKEYRETPEAIEKMQIRNKRYYAENKEFCLSKSKGRRNELKGLVEQIAIHYGCQNPQCSWQGPYDPSVLDFHHLDPQEKDKGVAQLYGRKPSTISKEINKCAVLCRNCHALLHANKLTLPDLKPCRVNESLNVETT